MADQDLGEEGAADEETMTDEPATGKRKRFRRNRPEKSPDELALDEYRKKLGNTKYIRATDAEMNALTQRAIQSLVPTKTTWLTEWGGQGLGHQVFDLSALLDIAGSFGNTIRWYARSLFSGGNEITLPGAHAALAGSLILVFGPGLTEKPRYAGDKEYFPTVEGGRMVTETMASTNDEERLTEIFRSLTKNAAKAYVSVLEVMVNRELTVRTFSAQEDDDGPYTTRLILEQARDDLAWLTRTPRSVTRETVVIGEFRAVDDRREGRFVIEPEPDEPGGRKPPEIGGTLAAELRHRALTTRTRVKARLRVIEPEEEWLPKARPKRYVLLDFEPASRRAR
jgi:hypothetical protein